MEDHASITAGDHRCEEASAMSKDSYLPCNRPARQIVEADGKELRMCEACAHHSKHNRGMTVVREYGTAAHELILPDIGGNSPPDPIDEAIAPYMDVIEEAESWLDGTTVEDEAQMKAVDALIKDLRSCKSNLAKAEKSATAPLHDAWKAEIARWKPTREDVDRRLKGLAAVVDPYKRKLAEEKEAARRAAYEEARAKERAAEEAARQANAASYGEQVAADEAKREAMEAKKAASAANRDKVTGLRTVKETVVVDEVALARWLWQNDREALVEWQADRARKLGVDIPGVVEIRARKEAY